jgi:hypothetical protein
MSDFNYRVDLPDEDIRYILDSEEWNNKFQQISNFDQVRMISFHSYSF